MSEYLFTSESVTEGHPDKLCDQVSDGILDALLKGDKGSRVACETLTKTGFVMVAGEVTSSAQIDIPKIVRGVVKEIGYSDSDDGLRLADLRRDGGARAAVARHRPGRRRQGRLHPRRAGRRRPGDDVRLRLRRDARADAAADHDGAQAVEEAGRRAQEGRRSTSCAPTARARSRFATPATIVRSASTRSSSPPSTAKTSSTRRSKRR